MIKIITDSASDIEAKQAEALGIILIPMQITFGEDSFRDKFDIQADEFYEKMANAKELPRTSQINPFIFEETFQKIKDNGDIGLVILMSSGLSGTYDSAVSAAKKFDNIYVVDSLAITVGEQCLISYAMQMIEQGMDIKEIVDALENNKKRIRILAILDTLEYLKKGGRISSATAFAGGLLNIKPVVTVEDGVVGMLGKARGTKNGNNLLNELIEKYGGIDYDMPAFSGYTGLIEEKIKLDNFIDDSKEKWGKFTTPPSVVRIGSTIGTHVGPGAVAIGFFTKTSDTPK